MSLLQQQEFDLEGAANYLGCNASDVLFALHKGSLRLAISTEGLDFDYAVLLDDLPAIVQMRINGLLPKGSDIEKPPALDSKPASSFRPQYIYLSHQFRELVIHSDIGEVVQVFENFAGSKLTVWLHAEYGSGHLKRLFLYVEDSWISHTALTKEELDRFKGSSVGSTERAQEEVPSSLSEPFQMPKKADEVAEAMVAYGNRFYAERGFAPTVKDLQGYMIETGGRDLQMSYDSGGQDYFFGDKPVSKRAFSDRYKTYRVKKIT